MNERRGLPNASRALRRLGYPDEPLLVVWHRGANHEAIRGPLGVWRGLRVRGATAGRCENVQTSASNRGKQRRKTSQYMSKRQAINLIAALDPRLIFLERAAARLILFEAGLLELDEAFHGLFASLAHRKPRRK
jgi:hypothetical protein